jgi:cytochrome c-type biogenesis protein CcmF
MYGGYVVHLGLAVAVIAVIASTSFARQAEVTLGRGQQTSFAGYVLRYEGQRLVRQPQREVLVAQVSVSRDARSLGRVTPSLNLYPGASEPIGTPSIRYGVFKDLYSSVLGFEGDGGERATFRFFLNPGVMWLWVGGGVMAMGGLLAAWPGRRRTLRPDPPFLERQLVGVQGGVK